MNEVAIIVPVYNGEKDIEKCLNSLLNQSKQVDILVVDDGSTDKTKDIVLKLKETHPNIYYYYKENSGIADTRNYGLSKVNHEYFGFLDSDDYIDSRMYELMLEKIKEEDSDICMCNFYWTYSDKLVLAKDIDYKDKKDIFTKMYATLWNKLYKTSWFKKTNLSFPKGLHYEDASFLYRLVLHMDKVAYVDEALVYYVQREGSITHTYTTYIADMIEVLEGIKDYYISNNKYEEYKEEREYVFIRFFLGNSYLRTVKINDSKLRKEILDEGYRALVSNFKDYKHNKYLKEPGLKNKYFRYSNKFTYYFNVYIFRLLAKLKLMK